MKNTDCIKIIKVLEIIEHLQPTTLNYLICVNKLYNSFCLFKFSMSIQHKLNKIMNKLSFLICVDIEHLYTLESDNLVLRYDNLIIFLDEN